MWKTRITRNVWSADVENQDRTYSFGVLVLQTRITLIRYEYWCYKPGLHLYVMSTGVTNQDYTYTL